jgi:hypothetical protein
MPDAQLGAGDKLVMREMQAARFLPVTEVLADLEKKAAEYEHLASEMREPEAGKLRKLAELCRGWIMSLKYGNWTS